MKLNDSSVKKLDGVHQDLQKVIYRTAEITTLGFIVTEGLRTLEKQKKLVAIGASRTLRSRHLTGHAVDLAAWLDDGDGIPENGEIRYDWTLYPQLNKIVQEAAKIEGIQVEWGGDSFGPGFKDGPHFQLPWKNYP